MDLPGLLNDPHFSVIFRGLQKACQKVFVDPSVENLNALDSVCNKFSPAILGRFLRYIIVPLGAHLSRRDDISNNIIQCMLKLLRRSIISDLGVFLNIYSLTLRQLQNADSPESVRETSEELKLKVLKCITQLVRSSTRDVRQTFLSRKYYSKISVGVFLCTQIAKTEKYIALKVEALTCLLFLTHVTNELTCDEDFKKDLAQVLMLMVPGISSACLNIVNSGETQNHKSIVLALQLWSRLVATVLSIKAVQEDTPLTFKLENKTDQNETTGGKESLNNPEEFLKSLNVIKLDKEWIKNTDKNLSSVTKIMVGCQNHQHWKVRLELSCSSYHLLNSCGMNIAESVGYLTETLIFLSQDENDSVSKYSKICIANLGAKCDEMSDKRLVDVVEENFYSLLTRLPRIFHGVDITLKERQLIIICGFLDILGPGHVPAVFRSCQHLERFLHCLIICATPDCSKVTLMEEAAIRGVNMESYSCEPQWRHLKYCNSSKCEVNLKKLCSKLVQYSDLEMLLNSLLDAYNAEYLYRKNIILLFILLFSSGSTEKFGVHSPLLKDIVSSLMESSMWNVPVNFDYADCSKSVIQENIVQICLLTEAIGCISEAAGPTVFLPLLLQCLYPILECAGSPFTIISSAGQISLKKLAKLYSGGSVSTVITRNVDYLSHHVMLKLRQAHKNPRVLSVLSTIMEHSSLSTLPSLHEIISDVFVQSCDSFQDINGDAFLHVFHTYLSCIKKWTYKEESCSFMSEKPPQKNPMILELLEYKETLIAANPDTCCEETSGSYPHPSQLMEEEEKKEENKEVILPDHVKLTRDILLRSLHFLPANNISRQILVLQILEVGIEILQKWTDVLLPVIHKIWSPFVQRFKTSNNPLLLQRAFHLLRIFACHSKDFIRARTVNEVLPILCKVLKDHSEDSKKKDKSDGYGFTQMYKLQLHLLSGLGHLALDVDAPPKHLYSVLDSATPYLSEKQPLSLQEPCMQLFNKIGGAYPDLVWLHLMSVCPNQLEFKAPVDGLLDYKFECDTSKREEYFKAVDGLLRSL